MTFTRMMFGLFVLAVCFGGALFGQTRATVPKGISTVNFKGTVYETKKTLTLNLKAGQTVNFTVTSSSGTVLFDAYYYPAGEEFGTPLATGTKAWHGELPAAKKFTIDLYTPDSSKAKYKFTMQVVKE